MTLSSLRDPSCSPTTHTTRFNRWGGWLAFTLLAGHLIFCHGCHGDEDNELCIPPSPAAPAAREIRNPKSEIRKNRQTQNQKVKTKQCSVLDFGFLVLDFFRISDFGFRIYYRGTSIGSGLAKSLT